MAKLHSFLTPPPDSDMPVDTRGKGEAVVTASVVEGCVCDVCVCGE